MPKIEYDIARSNNLGTLVETVNHRLQDGWDLYGDPFFANKPGQWCQAMVLREVYSPSASETWAYVYSEQ